ncbi:MAG TPA: Ig-like domain-containing protein [Pyrinomonadaceae bacterium]|nr:Ig-like domain-containing protein [Pyrinomonadaceae bacterium]
MCKNLSTSKIIRLSISLVLSYVLLISPLAPLALASGRHKGSKTAAENSAKTSNDKNSPAPVPVPLRISPAMLVPNITATKTDSYPSAPGGAVPGETISYSITISNAGSDATNVTFSDTIDAHTTLIAGTLKTTPLGFDDTFSVLGNVRIQVPDGAQDLLANDHDPDTGGNTGLTITTLAGDNSAPFSGLSANGGQVTATTGNGSFEYNPPAGFTGTDSFTYTVTDSGGGTATATVTLNVSGMIWFVDDSATVGGDGRLTKPFNCYTGASNAAQTCFSDTAIDDPGDNIFLFSGNYSGGFQLLNNQRLIGQGATDTLANIGGLTVPTHSDALPATGGISPTITTTSGTINAVSLAANNTLRGFTAGNTTGAKISGNGFGTLIVGKSTSPDVILNGTGQALSLINGTVAPTSGFVSVATTSSAAQGILLNQVGGAVSFGSTAVSGSATEGIFVTQSTVNVNFGNTTISGVTGNGIDIRSLAGGSSVTFGSTTVNKTSPGSLVNLGGIGVGNAGAVTFLSLGGTNTNGSGLVAVENTGPITVTNAGATNLVVTNGAAINITKLVAPLTPLDMDFANVSSSGATNAINLANAGGTITSTGGSLTASGAVFNISGGTASVTYAGDITQANNAALVSIGGGHSSGTITFSSGTLSATNGTGLQFNNADGTYNFNGTTSLNGGDAGIDIIGGSSGTFNFGANTSISHNAAGTAFNLNSSNANVVYSGSITDNNGRIVDIDNHDAGTVIFQTGFISASGSSATGLRVANCNGGIVSFNSQTTLSTVANTAADLSTNNSAGTINFNAVGNGLDITTTSGTGLLATGSGTIAIQGSDNSISSLTGTALTVVNTTISPSGLNFVSISSDGGANVGILLNNTGALGGLNITGDAGSTNNFSGGTIQNKTGVGISLTNTRDVVLDQMRLVNTDSSAINGAQVTNFTFTNGTIVDAGDASFESAIGFNGIGVSPGLGQNLNGTLTVTGSVFTNPFYSGVDLQSNNGTVVNANVSNNTFTNPGFSGVNFVGTGNTSTAFNLDHATIANNNITSTGGAGIQVNIGNSTPSGPGAHAGLVTIDGLGRPVSDPSHVISITANAISVDDTGTQAIIVANSGGNSASRAQTNFIVQNNGTVGSPLLGSDLGTVIAIGNNGFADMAGLVDNNVIDANHVVDGVAGNGIGGGNGAAGAGNAWTPRLNLLVTSNVITDVNGSGILLVGRGTSGEAYLKIANNNVATPNITGVARQSIRVEAGNASSADDEVYLNIFGNTCPGGATNVCAGSNGAQFIGIRKQGTVANTNDFGIFDAAGGPTLADPPSNADVRNFIDALNPHGAGTPDIITGNAFKRDTTLAPPLLAAPGGIESLRPGKTHLLTQAELDVLFAAAIERWKDTGLTAKQIAAMQSLTFELADLPEVYLAEVSGNRVRVDRDAGGHGWFVDSTPMDDAEFGNTASNLRRYTNPADAPAGRMDLLTAIMHEMGHRVGLCDSYSSVARDSLMYGYLTQGERRLPFNAQARNAIPKRDSETHFLSVDPVTSGETVNVNIGTLPAGKSVTITFEVQVNSPFSGPPLVTNQGTVSGTNFSNVLTDDPAVGGASDPTVTPIDLFDTTTALVSNLNPANTGDLVTFTATVSESPAQPAIDPTGTVDFIDTSNGNAVICNDVPLTAGAAQCQTSTLTSGTHNIRADYSGDGNFDPSQSNIVAQVVNACTPDPIVTSTADSGAGTLRAALANACSGDTITFNLAGPGPHTITLTTGELQVDRDVSIYNNSGENITVSGNNAGRVFNINAGKIASLIGLTISGGNSTNDGGAIINDGALTIVNSTLSGNTTASDGGAISTTATGTSLTLINTTISGNTAGGSGGGVIVLGGTMTSINCTITNNVADSDNNALGDGGGIRAHAGTTTLKNTIVAGNFNEDGASDAADDISGTIDAASSCNLIGTGGAGGLTNGVNNNQVGVANAGLGPLGDNGGTTNAHALLPASPAVEAGSNANLPADTFDLDGDTNVSETLPLDQRGPGFPRVADSQDANIVQIVDIGAYELHPSIEDIPNQATAEDTPRVVTFNIGDDTGSLISSITATSSNTALVVNANLSFSGSGGSRALTITPNPDASGTTTITVIVTATNGRTELDNFDLNVTEVNDAPDAVNDTLTAITEDSGTQIIPFADLLTNDSKGPANESGQTLDINNVSNAVGGTVSIVGPNVQFTPAANYSGPAGFDYTIIDSGTTNGVADPKTDTATASFTISSVNDAPVNTVPGLQNTNQSTPLTFSSGNGNQVSVADPDAGANVVQVTLTVSNGTLTLSGTAGLSFTFSDANGTGTGDGTADTTMTFRGTLTNINVALNGMRFTPAPGFSGTASLTITSNDLGFSGSGGPLTDTDVVNIQVIPTNITIQDAKVAEPPSGSVNLIFTVSLSVPAPAGGVSVDFTTVPQAPGVGHATAGADYTTTSGTVTFAPGEQLKSIAVPVLADAASEVDETFQVVLSSPVNGNITDSTGLGTITTANSPGTLLISELRTSGPAGAGDDFVEIYNNSDTPHTVMSSDAGYGVFKSGANCNATPVLLGTIPNATVIPARGHYLLIGSAYSLTSYAAGDLTMSVDIEDDRNVSLFATNDIVHLSTATRLDAVGFGANTGQLCDLLREGTTLPANGPGILEGSYQRDQCGKLANSATFGICPTNGLLKDSNNNVQDFFFADIAGTNTSAGQHLGAPGPEGLANPVFNINIPGALLDATVSVASPPNRVRDLTPDPGNNSTFGTISFRRRFVNNTGAPVTRLRFRIIDISTAPVSGGIADLRARTSGSVVVTNINDAATCLASTGSAATPCVVNVLGTTLETPPAQPNGGANNSTLAAGTVTLGTPLAAGASINLQFLVGVQVSGSFKFLFNVEGLP